MVYEAWDSCCWGFNLTTLTESPGVIDLRDAVDFKMILINIPAEMDSPPHHSEHVHPELGTTTSSGSSRRRLQSASRHFSFRQPCLSPSIPPVCSFWT